MTLVSDIITWTRRLLKLPNAQDIADSTILTYLNRFYLFDVPYRIQQFELKSQYTFVTEANVDRYNLPIDTINEVLPPGYCDGIPMIMSLSTQQFSYLTPSVFYNAYAATASGITGPYSFTLAQTPFIRGHTDVLGNLDPAVYITATDVSGSSLVVTDDGNGALTGDGSGTVNYLTGAVSVTFSGIIPSGNNVRTQTIPYTAGTPTSVLFYNNTFTLRAVPDKPYVIKFDAYMTPTAFLTSSEGVTFGWMADYLAHGTARRIFKDLGDQQQLAFYEPFFMEQERQVLRRSTREISNARTSTIFTGQLNNYNSGNFYKS